MHDFQSAGEGANSRFTVRKQQGIMGYARVALKGACLSDIRKKVRRKRSLKQMDRRVGDRRGGGISPAPDTPARQDTGKRQRSNDQKALPNPVARKTGRTPSSNIKSGKYDGVKKQIA
jgi:hypothetical protein